MQSEAAEPRQKRPGSMIVAALALIQWWCVVAVVLLTALLVSESPLFGYRGTIYRMTGIIFTVLLALACYCIVRAIRRWRGLGAWQRVYALVTAAASSVLLAAFIAQIAGDPLYAPRYLWALWRIEMLGGNVMVDEFRTHDVWVSLEGSHVGNAELAHLEAVPRLRSLTLTDTNVTDAGLAHLRGLTQLQALSLAFSEVTDAGLEHLKELTNLKRLELPGTKVTDAGVNHLQEALPNCEIVK